MADAAKQKLVQFLERKAWNPILKTKADGYSESERKVLERVQRKTQSQRERYESYGSAGELRQEFEDDLHSENARKTNADLKRLELPIQADVADEFFRLADRLGVTAQQQRRGSRRTTGTAHRTGSRSHGRTATRSTSNSGRQSQTSAKSSNGRSRSASTRTSKTGTISSTTRGRSSARPTTARATSRKTSSARKRSSTAKSTRRTRS